MGSSISLMGALGAGILSFLSPCILPLVPPYLCFLAGVSLDDLTRNADTAQSRAIHGRVVAMSFAFVLGFATVWWLASARKWFLAAGAPHRGRHGYARAIRG